MDQNGSQKTLTGAPVLQKVSGAGILFTTKTDTFPQGVLLEVPWLVLAPLWLHSGRFGCPFRSILVALASCCLALAPFWHFFAVFCHYLKNWGGVGGEMHSFRRHLTSALQTFWLARCGLALQLR